MFIKALFWSCTVVIAISAASVPTRADPFPGGPVYKDSERFQQLSGASDRRILRARAGAALRRAWILEERSYYDAAHELGLGRPSYYGTHPPCNCD